MDATPVSSDTAGSSAFGADWPVKAADAVDAAVNLVVDKAVRPVIIGARAVVFGILMGVLAIVVTATVSIGLIRLLDVYAFPGRVWASYTLVGFLFSSIGLYLWTKRSGGTPVGGNSAA